MKRNQKGFTLMELMVVIVIIAILAAVAVPLYINYVNDAKRTEAKGAIGAIITAEQVYFQKNSTYTNETNAQFLAQSGNLNVDLSGTQANWDIDITAASATGFTVTAVGKAAAASAGTQVGTYSSTTRTTWNP